MSLEKYMKKNIEPNHYPDLSNDEYHADAAISRTGLMTFMESPYKYWANYLSDYRQQKEATTAMDFGSAFHAFILEPEKFRNQYGILPEPVLLKDVGKVVYDNYKHNIEILQNSGKKIISMKEWKTIREMREALFNHSEAWALIENAQYEQSYFWQDEHSGLMIKARPDILRNNCIIDLKTCASADSRSFQRSMMDMGYHIQGAMVREGVKQLTGVDIPDVINICVEKTYPYQVGIKIIGTQALEAGHRKFKQALLDMKKCIEENYWPSYEPEIVELPSWAN